MHDAPVISRQTLNLRAIAFLALLAGCGDCGSCGDDKSKHADANPTAVEPENTASPTSTDAGVVKKDAAPEDASATSTKDGGGDGGIRELAPLPEALPRPSGAPMPMGAMQSCGVYDGPLCIKECDKGNCRQECDGVKCELQCKGGWCSQRCGPVGECKLSCAGGHCVQQCQKAEGCARECSGGNCS